MATWQEMLTADYNPVNTVRTNHQTIMDQRQAANLARMQQANPGYAQGGYGTQGQQQFTQYGPPTLHDNQDEWLQTQRDLSGAPAYEETGPDAGALSGGGANDSGIDGGRGNGPQSYGGGGYREANDPLGYSLGAPTGINQSTKDILGLVLGTPFSPFVDRIRERPGAGDVVV
jgi:hypothetical protein